MKNKHILLLTILPLFSVFSCGPSEKPITEQLSLVFTNDIHSYIGNTKDDNLALRLSQIGAYVQDIKGQGKNALLVDAGDSVQGTVYGAVDQGASVIEMMNQTGYDLSIPGNHDFDYTVPTFLENVKKANFDYISCNFVSLPSKELLFSPTKIYEFKEIKIGFVGVSTPETITASTPTYFQDENGNWIYDFLGTENPSLLYSSTQQAVDSIRDKVDYVVALGHLGIEQVSKDNGISSVNVINNTNGIDIFIDGHSHTLVEGEKIQNKDGKDVTLVQTGSNLQKFGVVTFYSNNTYSLKMEEGYEKNLTSIASLENKLITKIDSLMGDQIAVNDTKFYTHNPDKPSQRIIRARETNEGNLVADSFYWYLNEYKGLECDCIIQNAGGIRAEIEEGAITYKTLNTVLPFNNVTCLIEATGQEIKDALEMGVTVVDKWDETWDCPAENGGFLHVAGMKYQVDCSIPSKVVTDDKGMFVKVDGEYRTKDIKIYNKKTQSYDELDLTKTYRLGGINYILRNSGSGLSMFSDNKLVVDYLESDFQVFVHYITSFTVEGKYPLINTVNSPLTKYTNYQLDYDNPYGAGRINILNLPN